MLQHDLKRALVVAQYTFKELSSSKILSHVFFLGLSLLFVSWTAYSFSYGNEGKVAIDFGLGMLSLSSLGVSIFMGVGLISLEIDSRTIYMTLSRPISRSAFLMGKIMGLVALLILNVTILSIMTLGLYCYLGGKIDTLILTCVGYTILEACLILLVSVFFSLLANRTLAVIFTLAIYVAGHAVSNALTLPIAKGNKVFLVLLQGASFILPNLAKFNLKDYVLYQQHVDPVLLLVNLVYGITYLFILLLIICWIFDRKELE